MDCQIPKKTRSRQSKLVKTIIFLSRPEKNELEPFKFIDYICHTTPDNSASGMYIIKTQDLDLVLVKSGSSSWT